MSEMIEVIIDSLRVSLMSAQRVVILHEVGGERYLPIWIGPAEAESITVALQEVELARPMTHDLLKNTLALFNAILQRVEIVSLKEDIFYGSLVIEREGRTTSLDSRPSDAIALAVRAHAPIYVSHAVMNEAGIVPETDMRASAPADDQRPMPTQNIPADDLATDQPDEIAGGTRRPGRRSIPPPDDKRLDVFEDFLKGLGKDKGDEPPAEGKNPGNDSR